MAPLRGFIVDRLPCSSSSSCPASFQVRNVDSPSSPTSSYTAGVALAEPLPAEFKRRAVIQHQALGAPADALTGLDHGHLVPERHEPPGGGLFPASPAPTTTTLLIRSPSLPAALCR